MTDRTTHTVRLSADLAQRLEAEAARQRKATGDAVTKADIIRAALETYLARQGG